jgi:VanZ family protein
MSIWDPCLSLQGFKKIWYFIGWGLVVLIVYLSIMPMPVDLGVQNSDKLSHFAAYFVLMWWFAQILPQPRYFSLALKCIGLGVGMEIVQAFTEGRYSEFADVLANSAGVLVACSVSKLWSAFPALKTKEEIIHE